MNTEKSTAQDASNQCYIPKQTVQETRWDPNLHERIQGFIDMMFKRHGENSPYTYPYLDKEYKNESSLITVICDRCNSNPYKRLASSLKSKNRYAGCEVCNKKKMAETIRKKNKERQLRNHQIKDLPQKYGCIYKITNTKNGK